MKKKSVMKYLLKQLFALSYITLFCISILGCRTSNLNSNHSTNSNGKLKVLCTISMIEDIVKQIGGNFIETQTLIRSQLDPHTYQLVKGDNEKLSYADIIFYNGLRLEHGPSLRHFLTESPIAYSLGDTINLENPDLILYYNGNVDPHIWMDISLWSKIIPIIAEKLAESDPENAQIFINNGRNLQEKMLDFHKKLKSEIEKIPENKRYLVTSHDAFNYFAKGYLAPTDEVENGGWQKRFDAPEGLAPESQLSSYDLRQTLDHIKKYDINVIFPESNVSQASIRKLLDAGEQMDLKLRIANDTLYGDAMGPPGSDGDTYLKMIQHDVYTIVKHLNMDLND